VRAEQGYRDLSLRQTMLSALAEQLGALRHDLIVHGSQVLHLVRVQMPVEVRMCYVRQLRGEDALHSLSAVT
jgi:hypothetical protein